MDRKYLEDQEKKIFELDSMDNLQRSILLRIILKNIYLTGKKDGIEEMRKK